MLNGVDVVSLWDTLVAFMDRIVAWLYCVIGKGEWNPDYGR